MKTEFEDAARDVAADRAAARSNEAQSAFEIDWRIGLPRRSRGDSSPAPPHEAAARRRRSYRHPKKNWRLKRGATPQWYKQRQGIRTKAQSGAARVARFRPPGAEGARDERTPETPSEGRTRRHRSARSSRTWSSCATA